MTVMSSAWVTWEAAFQISKRADGYVDATTAVMFAPAY